MSKYYKSQHAIGLVTAFVLFCSACLAAATAAETRMMPCSALTCPSGWQHPQVDAQNWNLSCRNKPNYAHPYWPCTEQRASVTHDKDYTVAPTHKCWMGCMNGKAKTKANSARCSAKCNGRKVPAGVTAGFVEALDGKNRAKCERSCAGCKNVKPTKDSCSKGFNGCVNSCMRLFMRK